uniref:Mediator of RNA polymerase II transcription subunit 18 n=1 Tax=Candidozyma auris TaxID=498019 RepID=A0A0L0NVA8_CANAR
MVHQLLLCSSIPQSNYIQTVSTLQALTGVLHPQDIATYTLLTKPHNVFKPKFEPGKVNQIEQFYMRCTTTWNDTAASELNLSKPIMKGKSDIRVERLFSGKQVKHWTLQISDIPNAGKNPVLAHNFFESTLVHHHTASGGVRTDNAKQSGHKPNDETKGNGIEEKKMSNNNDKVKFDDDTKTAEQLQNSEHENDLMEIDPPEVTPRLDKTIDVDLKTEIANETTKGESEVETKDSFLEFLEELGYDVVSQYWQRGIRFFYGDIVIDIFKIFVRDDDPSQTSNDTRLQIKLLDESNAFQIKAYINYPKDYSVDIVNQGTKELVKLKELLNNLFELEVPERQYMDSRVIRNT